MIKQEGGSLRGFAGPLLDGFSKARAMLPRLRASKDRAHIWLLQLLRTEFLKYGLEDDPVEVEDLRKEILDLFADLEADQSWVDPRLVKLLDLCREVATRKRFKPLIAELQASLRDAVEKYTFLARMSAHDQPSMALSSRRERIIPIAEDTLSHPAYATSVITAFAAQISKLKEERGIDWLCFVEKDAGPIGMMLLGPALVASTNLPACFYREAYWTDDTMFVGQLPPKSARVLIVYDLIVTANGILHAASDLHRCFKIENVSAVALFGYGDTRLEVETENGLSVSIHAVGWHNAFKKEIDVLRQSKSGRTKNVRILSNSFSSRRPKQAPAERRGVPWAPLQGASNMSIDRLWKHSVITAYRKPELKWLKFRTIKEFERAVDVIWTDNDLSGLPLESPDGKSFYVPAEVVELLRSKGLKFTSLDIPIPTDEERTRRFLNA